MSIWTWIIVGVLIILVVPFKLKMMKKYFAGMAGKEAEEELDE